MDQIRKFLSPDAGPFVQLVKYGVIGVAATAVQFLFFYILAATALKCLTANDWAVRFMGLPVAGAEVTDSIRSVRFAVNTAVGFVIANIFCWLMNRWFVFHAGKFRWYIELGMFFATASVATLIATGASAALIRYCGLMTSAAVFIEVFVSFFLNFFVRKFLIFKG